MRRDEKLRWTSRRSCRLDDPRHQDSDDVSMKSCSVGRTSARNPVRIPRRCPTDGKLLELSDDLVQTPLRSSDQFVYPGQRRADTTGEPLINRERSERHAPELVEGEGTETAG